MILRINIKKWITFCLLLAFIFFSSDGLNKIGWNANLGRHVMIIFYIVFTE